MAAKNKYDRKRVRDADMVHFMKLLPAEYHARQALRKNEDTIGNIIELTMRCNDFVK